MSKLPQVKKIEASYDKNNVIFGLWNEHNYSLLKLEKLDISECQNLTTFKLNCMNLVDLKSKKCQKLNVLETNPKETESQAETIIRVNSFFKVYIEMNGNE